MDKIGMVGIDLAKNTFQIHAVDQDGRAVIRRKLSRGKLLAFMASLEPCIVAMEACAGAHYWGREMKRLGHEVRLIAPAYVKPFVKRQKNDAADAEAICEAALRPSMRFVALKSQSKQASAMVFKARDLLVRQKTQIINALRGHMMEFGIVAAQGPSHVSALVKRIDEPDFPEAARSACAALAAVLLGLIVRIQDLDKEIARRAREDDVAKRLMTIPGIGPITATAMEALAPSADSFGKGRDFAAWLGLTPVQNSTGGKTRLGRTSKMGQRDLRRLLIIGASTVVRWSRIHGAREGSWLSRMLNRKPPILVIVALANRLARIAWALMTKGGQYNEAYSSRAAV